MKGMKSFWDGLPKPFFVMAPMADVTDVAFRALVAKRGKPNVMFTEFVSADGLLALTRKTFSHSQECENVANPLLRDLQFTEDQRPIVAQIFSSKPEMIAYVTKLVARLGFDGVDINMGCPDRSIEKQGAGAALVKNPALAVTLIRAAQEASNLPVSVKTRIGYNKESLDDWLTALLEASPVAITLHLRTRKELSLVRADWEQMKKAVEIRNRMNPKVLLIGNGDIRDRKDGEQKAEEFGADGIMIGRGMFGNPWIFTSRQPETISLQEKLDALIELAHGFEKLSPPKSFAILKKHIKAFVTGFVGAAELRAKLMSAENAADLESIIKTRLKYFL